MEKTQIKSDKYKLKRGGGGKGENYPPNHSP